jgi:hypothetical protein
VEPLAAEITERLARWRASGRERSARPDWLESHTRGALAQKLAAALDAVVVGR